MPVGGGGGGGGGLGFPDPVVAPKVSRPTGIRKHPGDEGFTVNRRVLSSILISAGAANAGVVEPWTPPTCDIRWTVFSFMATLPHGSDY